MSEKLYLAGDKIIRVLIIDDDPTICNILQEVLESHGYQAIFATSGQAGLDAFLQLLPEIVLLDQELPDQKGLTICRKLLQLNPEIKIIFITAYPACNYAIEAVKAGAYDYIPKPFYPEEVLLLLQNAVNSYELERIRDFYRYKEGMEARHEELASQSLQMKSVHQLLLAAAKTAAPVLITGETGVGKNVAARLIHGFRTPSKGELRVNCSALSESLIESELFGHERGAFTGAVEVKKGVFEMANGGTLILDEIGDMPLHLQTKLLTVLDENKLRRIGGSRDIQLNLKIIATTNIDLEAALVHGRFRQDLYYRLSTFHIHIPPLRERPADIPGLCSVIFRQLARKDIFLSQDQISALELYPWPGNVRELKNVLERALILSSGGDVRPGDLINHHPHSMTTNGKPAIPGGIAAKPLRLADIEVQYTLGVLDSNGGNKTLTAKQLGVSINTLKRILQRSGRRAVHVRRMERAVRPSEEM